MPPNECGLAAHYGALAAGLPDGHFLFNRHTVPAPPENVSSDRIFMPKAEKAYDSWVRVGAV